MYNIDSLTSGSKPFLCFDANIVLNHFAWRVEYLLLKHGFQLHADILNQEILLNRVKGI